MQTEHSISQRRACGLVGLKRSSARYRSRRGDDADLRMRLRELALSRPRYGYNRLWVLLRRDGWAVNRKRVYRLYRQEGLQIRIKRRKKRASELRIVPPAACAPQERWSIDFVHDQLGNGQSIRVLTGVDHFTRQCVVLTAGRRQTAQDVTDALDRAIARIGKPACITVDNGAEFASNAFDAWAYARGIRTDFIRPGRPTENAMIETLNGKLRDECLNLHWFQSLAEAQHRLDVWKEEYNSVRPHSSLGQMAPLEYVARLAAGFA